MIAVMFSSVLLVAGCPSDIGGRLAGPAFEFTPGAEGIGDPYFPTAGNGGYDVTNYRLRIRYDPATRELTGNATITATATTNLSRFNLDLAGLTVSAVQVNGVRAEDAHHGDELTVTPASGLAIGSQFTVEVGYGGFPTPLGEAGKVGNGFLSGRQGAVALGQPASASSWFPVNDHPLDKATYDIEITVPDGLTALSNGVPAGTVSHDGWTTWKWSERVPMASYLSTLVIGRYRVTSDRHRGKPLVLATSAELPVDGPAERSLARTVEVADFLATHFGPYPMEAYGGIAVADTRVGYALETQSRPVYGPAFFRDGENTGVVAHELAHQWFGDSVSIARWSDLWLNEGFATYAEWLWAEHDGGPSVAESFTREYHATDWTQPALDPGPTRLFSRAVYKRGGLTVHALRLMVGDAAFFEILQTWTTERRNGNATTDDLIALAERISGRQLDDFFDAWLTGTEAPPLPRP
jgi:aminopeptidase N